MQDRQTFRVASYNIRKAIGGDWRRDPARILAVVRALGADIVAIQEGDYRFRGRAPLFEADEVLQRTGLTAIDLSAGLPGLGWHGNVLLVGPRLRVVSVTTRELPGLEPRGTVTVDVDLAGCPVRVVAAHLGLFPHHRRRQAELLMQPLDASEARPAVALGDFNAWGRLPRSLAPFRDAMTEVVCGPSYPARLPVAALDRIFHSAGLTMVARGVWREPPASVASDHLPIWADLKLG